MSIYEYMSASRQNKISTDLIKGLQSATGKFIANYKNLHVLSTRTYAHLPCYYASNNQVSEILLIINFKLYISVRTYELFFLSN